ncbi:hypothetical protein PHJA_001704600 [Phtheirospermum japonicum]|uniref:Uncharacterized protein n=1 Tax=Phtheirospermum japonicum TaxID=374723 RepID=A0A830CID1_9LAMI|nr:hypothetical protein PHJA_001704600 [Phtheirospermum japonicum]
MFKKTVEAKSQRLSGADLKKVKCAIRDHFPNAFDDDIDLLVPPKIPKTTHILSSGRNYELDYDDSAHTEPFWLSLIRESIWAVRSLFAFLVEQPSQLKYIEWPSFQSTLKTATLTLVLVAVLIVALSSVDSALSFLLALLSRRKA